MRTAYPFYASSLRRFNDVAESTPVYEVAERNDHFALSIDLPGMKKDEIKIEVLDNTLTVSGERKRFEKVQGTFKQGFTLPKSVSTDKIEALYEDGVLKLFIPKTPAAAPRTIEVQTGKSSLLEKFLGLKSQDATTETQTN